MTTSGSADRTPTTDLFTGTAHYYARYRAPYPAEVLDLLTAEFRLDGTGRLLDLGCGTGQIALPLHDRFDEVVALDNDPGMIAEAEAQGRAAAVTNVRWLVLPAEQIGSDLGRFRLVTIGSAFHWMNRPLVLERCHALLTDDGGVALLDMSSFWGGSRPWEQAVVRVVQRWLGSERRAGAGSFPGGGPRHHEVLEQAAFKDIRRGTVTLRRAWDIPSIIGHLYSTSYCNRALLGDNVAAFEADLRADLLRLHPAGVFEQETPVGYIFGHRA
ncbi:MAG: methyltransferase domain-containing protein [Dehalococcoidia bacterium]